MPNPSTCIIGAGTVGSNISQEDADAQALQLAEVCAWANLECTTTTTTSSSSTSTSTTSTSTSSTSTSSTSTSTSSTSTSTTSSTTTTDTTTTDTTTTDTTTTDTTTTDTTTTDTTTTDTTTTTTLCNDGLGLTHTFSFIGKIIARGFAGENDPCFCGGAAKTECAGPVWVCSSEGTNTITSLSRTDTCGPFYGECFVTTCNEGGQSGNVSSTFSISFDPIISEYNVGVGQVTLYTGLAPHTLTPPGPCVLMSGVILGFTLT